MAAYIAAADLELAMGTPAYVAIFDDTGGQTANASAVAQVINRAHSKVISYMPNIFPSGVPAELPADVPELLVDAELDIALCYAWRRHPEFARQMGMNTSEFFKSGIDTLKSLRRGDTQIAGTAAPSTPAAFSGIVTVSGPRMLIDSPDGTTNGGDF